MFLGHYVAWIASGIMYAAMLVSASPSDAPGPVAVYAAGLAGAIGVIIAGWTTANPTLYRAGLALQVASPNWKRWKVTLLAGLVTTAAALFPALVMRLLDFVSLYGLILVPMGAIIFADYYLIPKLNLTQYYAEKKGIIFNWAAGLTWIIMMAFALALNRIGGLEIYFLAVPVWFISIFLYLGLNKIYQRNNVKASSVN
jgi:purine-cytosine permease-like protein